MPRPRRRLIGAVIVLFWLLMIGSLFYRETLLPFFQKPVAFRQADGPQDLWLGVYIAEERVGFIHANTTPVHTETSPGVRLTLTADMALSLMDRSTEFFLNGTALQTQEHGLREFDFSFTSGAHELEVTAEVEEGMLRGVLRTAGEDLPLEIPVGDSLMLAGGMGVSALNTPQLEPGEVVYVDTFDPTAMATGRARMECTGTEELEVNGERVFTYVVKSSIGGLTSRAWVTEDGEVMKADTPFGFTLRRLSPEEAMRPVTPSGGADMIRNLAVLPTGKPVSRELARMRLRVSGVDAEQLPPDSAFQQRERDIYTIVMPEAPDELTHWTGLTPEQREAALASDAFIAADHPRIQETARAIVEGVDSPWEKALAIYTWVYENLEKVPVVSVPTALDVLETREGDCNEHTILFAALARAVELPTQVAIGLVWSDTIGGFGYHAWPEVYVGGQWLPMDPTLGQPRADATHIKIFNGDISAWTRLIPYIGQIEIEVLETAAQP